MLITQSSKVGASLAVGRLCTSCADAGDGEVDATAAQEDGKVATCPSKQTSSPHLSTALRGSPKPYAPLSCHAKTVRSPRVDRPWRVSRATQHRFPLL